jgi:thiopeptide-type bacteriocin biosynthesis protein
VLFEQTNRLINNGVQNIKDKKRILHSLTKYFLRSCYRSTPFGVSAAISTGAFENQPSNPPHFSHKVKIRSEYICELIEEINICCWNELTYRPNNTIREADAYYKYVERDFNSSLKIYDYQISQIEKEEHIEDILAIAKGGKYYTEIVEDFLTIYDIDRCNAESIIKQLIESKILLSTLTYNVFDKNVVQRLSLMMNSSKFDSEFADKLDEIINLSVSIGNNSDNIYKDKNNRIQIDLYNEEINYIPIRCKFEIERATSFLMKLRIVDHSNTHIARFTKSFENRYGDSVVPLLDVMDVDTGLGYPVMPNYLGQSKYLKQFNLQPREHKTHPTYSNWGKFVFDKYEDALRDDARVIYVTKEDLLPFVAEDCKTHKDTVLFTGAITKDNKGDFLYFQDSLLVGKAQACAGRFAYGSSMIDNLCAKVAAHEVDNESDCIIAEIMHLSQPRMGCISDRPNYYSYYIPFYEDAPEIDDPYRIPLSDLYLMVIDGDLLLFSKRLRKQIIPRISNSQNTNLFTYPIFTLLSNMGEDRFVDVWNWDILRERKYLPRVQFENIVLSRERWLLTIIDVFGNNHPTISQLKKYLLKNKVSKHITFGQNGDNIIPTDITNEKGLNLLYVELLRNEYLFLLECPFLNNSTTVLKLGDAEYANQIQVPIFYEESIKKQYNFDERINRKTSLPNLLPSNVQCIYIKLFSNDSEFDKRYFPRLSNFLLNTCSYDYFFFIRYVEDKYHIRIRFFGNSISTDKILSKLNQLFSTEIERGNIEKIQIDTYSRETERYGGLEGTKISELIFYHDSICVLNILQRIKYNQDCIWKYALRGVHVLFEDFEITLNDRVGILTELKEYYLILLKNPKSTITKSVNDFYLNHQTEILSIINDGIHEMEIETLFSKRTIENKKLYNKLTLQNIKYDIRNYVHMFINRLIEFNQNYYEIIIYSLLIKTYNYLKYN